MFKGKKEAARTNTDGTAAWFKNTENNARKRHFRDSIFSTKTSRETQNVYEAAILPEPEMDDEELAELEQMGPADKAHHRKQLECEWVAENLVDFVQEVTMLHALFVHKNQSWTEAMAAPEKLPNKGFPPGMTYKWKVERDEPPQELVVEDYVENVLAWLEKQISDERVFPTDPDQGFPVDFLEKNAKKMFQRMFRVQAIMLVNPLLSGVQLDDADAKEKAESTEADETKTLLRLFSRFLCFATYWQMLKDREVDCVHAFAQPVLERYNSDRRKYHNAN